MNFELCENQQTFRDKVLHFARGLTEDVIERDKASQFSRDAWKQCAEFGLQGMAIPKEYGGCESTDFMTGVLGMEAMGEACRDLGLAFALNAQIWTVQHPILRFGTEDQKQRILPGMCSGNLIGAHALTEPNTGSDVFSLETVAQRCEGGYRLNGAKRLVTLGPIADLMLVFATVDPSLGRWGVTAFIVERDSPGLTVGPVQEKMGLRTVPLGELTFTDCFVPESNRLGAEGNGFSISQHSLEFERCSILASQIGAMQHQLDVAIEFARSRQQFGQAVGKFQSVSNRIAEMRLRIETSRLLLYKVAWLKQHEKPAMLEAAMLKLHLSEAYVESSLDAIRIHGGRGYLTDVGSSEISAMRSAVCSMRALQIFNATLLLACWGSDRGISSAPDD